tara:strand:- start:201 stop:320 length:120 start_codon:yes stop_codon:yes gene_type:complete
MEKLLKYYPNLVMGVVVLSLIAFVGFCTIFLGIVLIEGW